MDSSRQILQCKVQSDAKCKISFTQVWPWGSCFSCLLTCSPRLTHGWWHWCTGSKLSNPLANEIKSNPRNHPNLHSTAWGSILLFILYTLYVVQCVVMYISLSYHRTARKLAVNHWFCLSSKCCSLICLFFLLPSFLPSFLACLLACFLACLLASFLASLLPCFLASLLVTLLPCFLLSSLPCFLASLLRCFLACYLVSLFPRFLASFFLACFLACFLASFLPFFLACFLPSCLPSCLPAFRPACLPAFLPSFLPSVLNLP